MPVPIQQIATFTGNPFAGNPAFVITLERPRPLPVLQALCRQLRETVLAVLWTEGEAVRLTYVTPEGTHSGPGHSTHAAAWTVFNRIRPGATQVDILLDDGDKRTVRRRNGRIATDWPMMPFENADAIAALAESLGARPHETFNAPFGMVAIFGTDAEVASMKPDLAKVARLPSNTVIVTAPASDADFAIRVFAPKLGLPEDPVCGTAHRILAPLWAARLGKQELVSHQLSPRGGLLYCRVDGMTVTLGGEAALVLDGTVALPG